MRKCTCDSVHSSDYTPDQCRRCWKFHHDRDYRRHCQGGPLRLPCVHLGEATGEMRECPTCPGSTRIKSHTCSLHGSCTTVKPVADVRCCSDCPDFKPRTEAIINNSAGGLGDALLGLLAVCGLREDHPDYCIEYRTHPATHAFVRLFNGYDRLCAHERDEGRDREQSGGANLQLNWGYDREVKMRCAEPRVRRYCRNIGASRPVLPSLRRREEILAVQRDFVGSVILAPFCSCKDERGYPVMAWLAVEKQLREAGLRCLILDSQPERCRPFQSPKLIGAEARQVASAVLNAACLVGGDSAPAHLSGILGKPTLVLSGVTDGPSIFGAYPDVQYLHGHLPCRGCWWQQPYQSTHCQPLCPALASIAPYEVVAAVERIRRRGGGGTL